MDGDQDMEELLTLYPEDGEDGIKKSDDLEHTREQQVAEQVRDDKLAHKATEPILFQPLESGALKQKLDEGNLRYRNAGGNFYTGVDIDSKEEAERRILRAKRFGITPKTDESSLLKLQQRAKKFGVQLIEENGEVLQKVASLPPLPMEGELRPDAIHLHGTSEMSNKDVLEYCRAFGPRNVEWINDFSCNVVWDDPQSARRALYQLGKSPLVTLEEGKTTNSVPTAERSSSVPALRWRLGEPHPKAKQVLLRYATTLDIKRPGAAKESQYYKKYGNPNQMPALGLRGRKLRSDLRERIKYKQEVDGCPSDERREQEEPMEVDDAGPLAKRTRTLYADVEKAKGDHDKAANEATMDEDGETTDLRTKLERKRIRKRNLKKPIEPNEERVESAS